MSSRIDSDKSAAGSDGDAPNAPDLSAPPSGFGVSRNGDGDIVVDAPAAQDRLAAVFLAGFSLIPIAIGAGLVPRAPWAGASLLALGALILWPGAYFLFGRIELVLGPDRAAWRRIFVRRWPVHSVGRAEIVSIGSTVRIRTNGRPTSWGLHFTTREKRPLPAWLQDRFPVTNHAFHDRSRRRAIAGSWKEAGVLWLGNLVRRWADKPFDSELDRTVDLSSD